MSERKRLYSGHLEAYIDEAIPFAQRIDAALRPIIQDMNAQGYSWRDIELFVGDEARDIAIDEVIHWMRKALDEEAEASSSPIHEENNVPNLRMLHGGLYK